MLQLGGRYVISLPLEGHWKPSQQGIDDHNLSNRDTHVWKPTAAMLFDALHKANLTEFEIDLHELDSIRFRMKYTQGAKVGGFRPHAFVSGVKS